MVTERQPGPAAKLPPGQSAIAAANIRALRQRNGWTQAQLGQLMGWPAPSTVCAAEGRRGGRQRRFARWEIDQLAAIFGVPAAQLLSRCVTCGGQPPPGYACLACKAARPERAARPAATSPALPAAATASSPPPEPGRRGSSLPHQLRGMTTSGQPAGGPGLARGRDRQRHLPRH
jgi:transcriptional regulator with XRE-family HTH domain